MKHRGKHSPVKTNKTGKAANIVKAPDVKQAGVNSSFAGKPLDGSQYLDVVEEQAYADQRPTPEEQKPRFSFLTESARQSEEK